ncbi:hypothetical protein BX600DRAFT_526257 [Xylariales sp. PMI_506]|nr:hypothetical protein BX600DRAFT_526257 [Xylariales sp. PMI_506]
MKASYRNTLVIATLALVASTQAASSSKRGLLVTETVSASNLDLLESKTSWYVNWGSTPSTQFSQSDLDFVPMVHDAGTMDSALTEISSQADGGYLLTFNEPNVQGQANMDPGTAADHYVHRILPLRDSGKWKISHPVVSSSPDGLVWLQEFVAACRNINGERGCPSDFIALHYYGPFDYLNETYWPQMSEFYNDPANTFLAAEEQADLRYWFTEIAIPAASPEDTLDMMQHTLDRLDNEDLVARYGWFALTVTDESWVGPNVALENHAGELSPAGKYYFGA